MPSNNSRESEEEATHSARLPRLRHSCDACAATKVKCSQERPQCSRCMANNINCVYGISRRQGKHVDGRRKSRQNLPLLRPTQQPTPPLLPTMGPATDHFEQLDLPTTWPGSDSTSTTSSNLYSSTTGSTPSSSSHFFSSSGDIMLPQLDLADSTDFSQQIGKDAFMDFSSLASSVPQPLTDVPGFDVANSGSSSACSRHGDGSRGALDCYAAADAILATLHFRSAASNISSHSQPAGARSNVLYFDYVVRTAHVAICKLQSLLHCRCASDAHMSLLFSSIISIALYWYRTAAGVTDQENPEFQRPSSNSSSSSSRLPSVDIETHLANGRPNPPYSMNNPATITTNMGSCAATGFYVAHEPVTIGSYAPEAEDQESMRRALVLSKLRHVERVIDALARVDANISRATGVFEASENNLNKSLSGWLRGELRKTKARIGEAYDGSTGLAFSTQ